MKKKKVVARNKKAFRDYDVEETYEAGMVLRGQEVKSVRAGQVSLAESYAHLRRGEVYLYNAHISPYAHSRDAGYDPYRPRKLLLRKAEIRKLVGKIKERGYTLVPLKIYFSSGFAKVELALAKGKRLYDKRRDIAKKDAEREIARALKERERSSE